MLELHEKIYGRPEKSCFAAAPHIAH
jgi:hypothetical protein